MNDYTDREQSHTSQSQTPGGVSVAGSKFIQSLPPAACTLPDRSLVSDVRIAGHTEYVPRAKRALEKHKVTAQQTAIDGVACIEAFPSSYNSATNRTLLYFYGGGFIYGGAYDDLCITAALAAHTGARIVAPEYRLAPEHPHPAALEDGLAVYRAVIKQQPANSIAVSGESAGGNLALSVLLAAQQEDLAMPSSLALLSPWCDLSPQESQLENGQHFPDDPTLHPDDLESYAQFYAAGKNRSAPEISPIYAQFNKHFPRTLITTATRDILMYQCIRLSQVMRRAEIPVELQIYPDLCHVFECYDEIPEAAESLQRISRFLF